MKQLLPVTALMALAACTPAPAPTTDLVLVRPYPSEGAVCQVIGESAETVDYLDHTALLIGCPAGEADAIAAQLTEGAVPITEVDGWALMSLPLH